MFERKTLYRSTLKARAIMKNAKKINFTSQIKKKKTGGHF